MMKKAIRRCASVGLGMALFLLPSARAYQDPSSELKSMTQQAKQAYVNHDYDGAVLKYQQALKLANGVAPKVYIILYSNLGAALREGHKYDQAQDAFKSAISYAEKSNLERDPSATNAMRQYAALLKRIGKNVDAEIMESRASGTALVTGLKPMAKTPEPGGNFVKSKIAMAPPSITLPNTRASLQNKSIDELKQMIADKPDDFSAYELLANRYIDDAKWSEAEGTLQTINRDFRNQDKDLHLKLAFCYQKDNRYQDALNELQSDLAIHPSRSEDYLSMHQMYVNLGDLKSAIEIDQAFLAKFPDDPRDGYVKGLIQQLNSGLALGSGDKRNATEEKQNWPNYYFPLKVYAAPVDDSYHFARSTMGMSEQTPAEVLNEALQAWASASNQKVSFVPTQRPEDANIEVTFTNNPNGLEPGRAGVTHWESNQEHQKVRVVILIVDGATGKPVAPEMLMNTTLHELGHALGLEHSSLPDDIMYPQLHGTMQVTLSDNDAKRVTRLYTR